LIKDVIRFGAIGTSKRIPAFIHITGSFMNALDLVKLTGLMAHTSGSPAVKIGLIDGPVVTGHPELTGENLRNIAADGGGVCREPHSMACLHGTFVAGILSAKRASLAPAICPNCTVLVRPIFGEAVSRGDLMPSATPQELAAAITACIGAGAQIINLSLALAQPSTKGEQILEAALKLASNRGVIVVAAAGNQGTLGSTAITRHPWVIPVAGYDLQGRPMSHSNVGSSIGRRGLGAPGEGITSLGAVGKPLTLGGTSAAAPFVTGAIALLWSEFPSATAAQLRIALTQANTARRRSVVPPLLNAELSHEFMHSILGRR
jgi:subtilisin family serine protease